MNRRDGIREVRIVGRGGQGVVTAGDILGAAAIREGRWAQAIPTFGPERRGALCTATVRIADDELLLKCAGATPSVILVLDPTIWKHSNVLAGVAREATLVFNSSKPPAALAEALFGGAFPTRAATEPTRLLMAGEREGAMMLMAGAATQDEVDGDMAQPFQAVPLHRLFAVDATGIAMSILGRPITNTAMMGAFVGATGHVGIEAVEGALTERFGSRAAANIAAARAAMSALRQLEA